MSYYLIYIGLLSVCVGSFLNVVIYRLPLMLQRNWRKECYEFLNLEETGEADKPSFNLMWPRSTCPHCKTIIPIWANIPIVSFILLRGKCYHCKEAISWRYPAIELLTLMASILIAWHFGFSLHTLYALVFTWVLICLIFIDIDHQLLPDNMTLSLLWLGLLINLFAGFATPNDAILGAIFGYCGLWIFVKGFYLITGKEGMGHGDFKLFAALGAWLGWQLLPFIILTASLVGAILGIIILTVQQKDHQTPIPFGPYLAIAGWIALLWGHDILSWYFSLSHL